jgi:TPR repeat protein
MAKKKLGKAGGSEHKKSKRPSTKKKHQRGNSRKARESALGRAYELGEGLAADVRKARHWYKKAAAQGDAWARRALVALPKSERLACP